MNNLYSETVGAVTFSIMNSRKTKAALSDSPVVTERPGNTSEGLIMFSSETNTQNQIRIIFRRLLLLLSLLCLLLSLFYADYLACCGNGQRPTQD